jgi:hypothetical protein
MKGKVVDCIRIRQPAQAELPKPKAAAKKPPAKADDDMNDALPW